MRKRALMILGTASHVGKSILTAGLGRILADDGYRVAPFKAQNMSLNSAATPDGGEIGRAQALQAEACRVVPRVEMNPILLKPSTDMSSQIVLLGRIWEDAKAWNYHTRLVEELFPEVLDSYRRLAASHDLILLEGAGSPAEINLREHDIVNMRMAHAADAACLLVGDIERGGVFASLLGTMDLLDGQDRERIRGFVINKFRGDESLLRSGIAIMESRLGLPCAGVVPYLHSLALDEEDGVALEERRSTSRHWNAAAGGPLRPLRVGVIAFPHMANFTDFDALVLEPSVSLAFLDRPQELPTSDLLILPGSKQTIDDLKWLHQRGFVEPIRQLHHSTLPIIGICGGFQMLGISIEDPFGIESAGQPRTCKALGLLPIRTVFSREKTVRCVRGRLRSNVLSDEPWPEIRFRGYEIHVGETVREPGTQPFAKIFRDGTPETCPDGAVSSSGRVFGTYVHGLFDEDDFRHSLIAAARASSGLAPLEIWARAAAGQEARIDRLANHLRQSLDLALIKSWIVAPPAQAPGKGNLP
jgi:adenosylcobyric acid synthase